MDTSRTSRPRGPRRGPARPPRRCPLTLWRTREPSEIAAAEVAALAGAVAATAILHERRWPAARAGDPAAAVAVAIDRIHRHGPEGPVADVVMGNLLVLAHRDGDPTAGVVLSHALRALARSRPGRAELPRFAQAWTRRSGWTARLARARRA
ncbi:hypothetical protein SAMN02799643_03610 [Methylobacterium sp. UNCCL125]|jgi:hypothetical protein|nr:hypothetical protein SAMN02799643_03610 [Methylobacterium sp. UNCCL125]